MPTPEYNRALAEGSRAAMEWYLPDMARKLKLRARGRAGGQRRHGRGAVKLEEMALASVAEESVRKLGDQELLALHRRCHALYSHSETGA